MANAIFTLSRLLARGLWLLMSPLPITWPAITIFRMLGFAEPSLFEQPNLMSPLHAIRNASLYFFYLTCEFSPHYARYVLVHALLLVFWYGYRLFLLYHPDPLLTMALVSMALHVSCMQSPCKKEWRTGHQMILSAVRHGVAEEFIQFCTGLHVNKPSRITLYRIGKAVTQK